MSPRIFGPEEYNAHMSAVYLVVGIGSMVLFALAGFWVGAALMAAATMIGLYWRACWNGGNRGR